MLPSRAHIEAWQQKTSSFKSVPVFNLQQSLRRSISELLFPLDYQINPGHTHTFFWTQFTDLIMIHDSRKSLGITSQIKGSAAVRKVSDSGVWHVLFSDCKQRVLHVSVLFLSRLKFIYVVIERRPIVFFNIIIKKSLLLMLLHSIQSKKYFPYDLDIFCLFLQTAQDRDHLLTEIIKQDAKEL